MIARRLPQRSFFFSTFENKITFRFVLFLGIAGLVAICGIGAYKFRHRGNMTKSMFLMQLRVTAQGAVVGALTCGLIYSLVSRYWKPHEEESGKHD